VEIVIAYALLGAFAGTLAGMLGVGGGLVIVPVLIFLWQPEGLGGAQAVQLAIGTSLAVIVFTSLSSVRAHHRRGSVLWPVFWRLTPGILLGAWLGASLASLLPQASLMTVFALFELLVAAQMSFALSAPSPASSSTPVPTPVSARASKPASKWDGLPGPLGMGLAGGLIGAVSALVGIGGGTMTVPFLSACKLRMQQAVGTSAACGLPIAMGGTVSYIALGWGNAQLPAGSVGYVFGPALLGIAITSMLFAPLGAMLAHRLSTRMLKRIFAAFLAVLGLWMLASQW
jgi:uncharacterized membrane protein YfcA